MERIQMAHGGGGEMTRRLIEEHILAKLTNPILSKLEDAATLDFATGRICMTTDAFVVQPLFFPGGDIGRLSVCGTVNDLVVMGAIPRALSLALIIEEGFEIAQLDRVLDSIAIAAKEAGVVICTGDTKVVERGRGDGLVITTAGIGERRAGVELGASHIQPGDAVFITGRIAEHGLAVMSVREGLEFETEIRSDAAPLGGLANDLLSCGANIRFMRDPTRGGLAGLLADLSEETALTVEVEEAAIPITATVRHASEMLGLDPLLSANEGKIVFVAPAADAEKVLMACKNHALGMHAAQIGRFVKNALPLAELLTRAGGKRILQRPYGEELPRIC